MTLRHRLSVLVAALTAVLALAGSGMFSPTPAAARAPAAALDPDQQALVQRATDAIQALKSVSGRFTQTDANGATSTGVLYLQRPGKARFEYDPPAGLLVVSDGHFVGVSDRRLKTFNEYPLGRTPLVLLLARQVRLDRGVTITGVEQTANGFSISARDGKGVAEGRITLLFGADPTALKGWVLVDGQGRRTRVDLGPLSPAALSPALFDIRDPRSGM